MNQKERAELKSIIRGRFKLLRKEVQERGNELIRQADNITRLQLAELSAPYKRQLVELNEKLIPLNIEFAKICQEAEKDGLEANGYDAQFRIDFYPMRRNKPDMGWRILTEIDRAEQDALEKLFVDTLQGDEAKGLLASIPSLDELIEQLSSAPKQIEA